MRVSGGGGGLMFDLTPDLAVTLDIFEPSYSALRKVLLQCGKTLKITSRLVFFLVTVGIKPFKSCIRAS